MITVTCTCGEKYQADEQHVGRRIRCNCGKELDIVAAPNPRTSGGLQERSHSPSRESSEDGPVKAYPRRIFKSSVQRRWIFRAGATGILLASWAMYRIANLPPEETTRTSVRPTPLASPAPVATVQPVPPPCPPEAQVRPRSGTELGGKHRGGLGRQQVANGTAYDAVAVLIDNATQAPLRAIFVRSSESGLITSVLPGRYRLRFQLGLNWLAERRFCRKSGTFEFDSTFDFEQVESERGTKYSTYEVTLHPVVQGTAKTHELSDVHFELPPL